jgi:hypothetical protein
LDEEFSDKHKGGSLSRPFYFLHPNTTISQRHLNFVCAQIRAVLGCAYQHWQATQSG